MKAAIKNPYLDTLGGGERYTMAFARALVEDGYKVRVEWKDKTIKKKLQERFGYDLSSVEFIKSIEKGEGYDVCFWVSDGSVPLLRARKNILHFQVPFQGVNGSSLINKMKLMRIEEIVCNSYFTKEVIDKEFGVDSVVVYPPVDVDKIKPKRKKNIILSVGRFSQLKQAKNQEVLVEVFKKMVDDGLKDWELILAGGSEVGSDDYLAKLKEAVLNYPIQIIESPPFSKLVGLYGMSKIFWSASGFGVDENVNPERVEHFGITVTEAMSAKSVPVVVKAGGYREIVASDENGFFWENKGELSKKTKLLIEDGKTLRKMAKKARESVLVYEYGRFDAQVKEVIK